MSAGILLIALLIDHAIGWPERLYSRVGHPVTWLGKLIERLESRLNRWTSATCFNGRLYGLLTLLLIVAISGLPGALLQRAFESHVGLWWCIAVAAWPLLAMRSLREHVEAVANPLLAQDLPGARHAVSMIVGRNPETLDEAGIARAALESLAENTSDGIVAPLFWAWLFGLPGLFIYKSVNTLDSMIGHHSERYEHYGWASANLDDLMNLIPARLTGLLFALQGPLRQQRLLPLLNAIRLEAPQHRSPNAGWPESALAQILGVRLAGPRHYGEDLVEEPYFNPAGRNATAQDLRRGLDCYKRLMYSVIALLIVIALIQFIL